MLDALHRFFNRTLKIAWAKIVLIGVLTIGFSCFAMVANPRPAFASSKIATPEALDMAISEAAQEFVDSILDDYGDILEGTFDIAYDPLKSAIKDVNKQITKVSKPAKEGSESEPAPALTIDSAPFETAIAAFDTLSEQTDSFRAQLETAPDTIRELIEAQIGAKMDELDTAIASVTEAVGQITEDTTTLQASEPDSTAAFTEHTTLLKQAVEAVDVAIDGFDT
ncbi:MAG: hypothetical protein DCF25_21570 [Leptolyngbya foveolarum]|uniref:Uncharacterized protein n=1 Tax=Leptolyngbya foveolarum TaxID=47253 RepID=A0A2W4TKQ8_9CYAN|nr:MAG: hypothetical protein DCF25_21570 [Leptolyngbya foveolarum]